MQANLARCVIIGGGPTGCTAGKLLAEKGARVTIFDSGKRPDLVVGESLIPAVIPLLSDLKLLERIQECGFYKPGASIFFDDGLEWKLDFSLNGESGSHHAYNVCRRAFDMLFREGALQSGCEIVDTKPTLRALANGKVEVKEVPDATFVIDASGRARVLSKVLGIKAESGGRRDIALFAHFDRAMLPHGGNIHMTASLNIPGSWSWRIPLKDRVSVGIVLNPKLLMECGPEDEVRFDRLVSESSLLAPYLPKSSRRLTRVARYSNYQLISTKMYGRNWAMAGDAAGFVDPVFSSGTYLALWAAQQLAEHLSRNSLADYERSYRSHLHAWQELSRAFYDGRFFTMIRLGRKLEGRSRDVTKLQQITSRIVSGISISSPAEFRTFLSLLAMCASGFNGERGQTEQIANAEDYR